MDVGEAAALIGTGICAIGVAAGYVSTSIALRKLLKNGAGKKDDVESAEDCSGRRFSDSQLIGLSSDVRTLTTAINDSKNGLPALIDKVGQVQINCANQMSPLAAQTNQNTAAIKDLKREFELCREKHSES